MTPQEATSRRSASPVRVAMGLATLMPGEMTGTAAYVEGLLGAFSQRSHGIERVLVVNPLLESWAREIGGHGARIACVGPRLTRPRHRRSRLLGSLAARVTLGEQFPVSGVDAVHYPLTLPLPRTGLPSIVSLHDLLHLDHPELFSRAQLEWRSLAYDRAAQRASLVLTVSDASRERIVDALGIAPAKVRVAHHGVDRRRFSPTAQGDDERLLREAGLSDVPFVFYPAALWPHKNHVTLLQALSQVEDRRIRLVLTGPTYGGKEALTDQIARLGIADRVEHLGFVPTNLLPVLYRTSLALVYPSRYEGFGMPVVEAMASGCPVVTSDVRPMTDLCGDSATYVSPGDAMGFAAAIDSLASDESRRAALSKAGIERAKAFSWDRAAKIHAAAYVAAVESTI